MILLANSCPNLNVIRLKNCRNITDQSIDTLSQHCPLSILHLAGCSEITNFGLDCLASNNSANTLKNLSLMGLVNITDDGVEKLVKACTNLAQLDMMNCRQISMNLRIKLAPIDVSEKSVLELKW